MCGDKVRGFYRPPAATMVVGRRKLLALVANDRLLEISAALAAPLNILRNNSRVIKGDHVSVAHFLLLPLFLSRSRIRESKESKKLLRRCDLYHFVRLHVRNL